MEQNLIKNMKKIFTLFILFISILGGYSQNNDSFDKFLTILAKVESSGNPGAFNKSENAIGIYQIRPAYFKDAQKQNKELNKYSHSDCYRPDVAKVVVKSYMERYCKNGNFETWAKSHNGGGCYYLNKNKKFNSNLEIYWAKFRKIELTIK